MKKALALVLALVLALSMAVNAFAAGEIVLKPVKVDSEATRTNITPVALSGDNANTYFCVYEQGAYYFAIDNTDVLEDIELTVNGNVTAEVVKYDVAKHKFDGESFYIYDSMDDKYFIIADWSFGDKADAYIYNGDKAYDNAKKQVEQLNEYYTTTRYIIVPTTNVYIVKFVVNDNYSAHYTTGTIKIEAYNKTDKEDVAATVYVINDVVNFEFEMIKYASAHYDDKTPAFLTVDYGDNEGDLGYSDYLYAGDYGKTTYSFANNRTKPLTSVVPTTGFGVIAGEGLIVKSNGIEVDIPVVSASQKGVNFQAYPATELNEEGYTKAYWENVLKKTATWEIASIDFGFLGDQVVKGDFTVSYTLDYNWYTLRHAFGLALEEDDIVTYYVLKDGKVVKEYVVDYATIGSALYDDVEIELDLKDTTLGQYSLVLEVPSSEVAEESNPNTGAESVVGVVAALAVVSLASAAAVSLKK